MKQLLSIFCAASLALSFGAVPPSAHVQELSNDSAPTSSSIFVEGIDTSSVVLEEVPMEEKDSPSPAESSRPQEEIEDILPSTEPVGNTEEEETGANAEGVLETESQIRQEESAPSALTATMGEVLATIQADNILGYYGLARDPSCAAPAAVLVLAEYEGSEDPDENYASVWEALRQCIQSFADAGHTSLHCSYQDGVITAYT